MKGKLTRKQFLEVAAKSTIGGAVGFSLINLANSVKAQAQITWPLPYEILDPEHVRKLGHQFYWTGKGCSYGAFKAIF